MRATSARVLGAILLGATACVSPQTPGAADAPGTSIVIGGERFDIGAPVVLWFEEGGYSAYSTSPRFSTEGTRGLRYRPGRRVDNAALPRDVAERVERGRGSASDLAQVVDQFVVHYDACGTSRVCFQVLQDQRDLSVHFLLDLDGTLYQTLDVSEQAWHAAKANARSVGVEIAHVGAFSPEDAASKDGRFAEWYAEGAALDGGTAITLPERFEGGHFRNPGLVLEPARDERLGGVIQGQALEQYDFTVAQYETLAHLASALSVALPGIKLDAPRNDAGEVRSDALSEKEYTIYSGLLGHYHVTTRKIDPGPAFDWEAMLSRSRELRAARVARPESGAAQ